MLTTALPWIFKVQREDPFCKASRKPMTLENFSHHVRNTSGTQREQ